MTDPFTAAGFDPVLIALTVLIYLAAGTIKGTVGIGFPTACLGMTTQYLEPHTAVALVIFPTFLSNAWQIYRIGGFWGTVRRYRVFLALLLSLNLAISTWVTAGVPVDVLMAILGVAVVSFSLFSLAWSPPRIAARHDRIGQVVAGTVSGVLGGLTSVWAAPMMAYLMARRVDRDEFVRAVGTMIFLGMIPLIIGFWQAGMLTGPKSAISMSLTVPVILGFTLGEILRRKLDGDRFRKAVLWVFLLMGLNLIRRAVF